MVESAPVGDLKYRPARIDRIDKGLGRGGCAAMVRHQQDIGTQGLRLIEREQATLLGRFDIACEQHAGLTAANAQHTADCIRGGAAGRLRRIRRMQELEFHLAPMPPLAPPAWQRSPGCSQNRVVWANRCCDPVRR